MWLFERKRNGRGASTATGRGLAAITACIAFSTLVGCGAGYGYTEVSSAPYDLTGYPTAYYGGRTVYLIDNRWMYPDAGAWFYYPREPNYLYQQRTYFYGGQPYRYGPGYGPSYSAPAVRTRPYVQQAPPAGGPAIRSMPPNTSVPRSTLPAAPRGPRMSAPPARR